MQNTAPGYHCMGIRTQNVHIGIMRNALTVMIRTYAWLGRCGRFAWRQYADTEGKRVVNAMGYIDQCRP